MVADGTGVTEPDADRQSKLDEYLSMLKRRRSDTEAAPYVARVRNYASLQKKRWRAAAVRKHVENVQKEQARRKVEGDQPKPSDGCDRQGEHGEHMSKRRGDECVPGHCTGSLTRSGSHDPVDCGCRRRRRRRCSRRRRRRRRSCRRRRRSCRRRRRRSRRRRRRSCRRRRRKCR